VAGAHPVVDGPEDLGVGIEVVEVAVEDDLGLPYIPPTT
jgi:hypothetical protein